MDGSIVKILKRAERLNAACKDMEATPSVELATIIWINAEWLAERMKKYIFIRMGGL